jgi:DNA-binding NarL/FixJ family response regulator
VAEARLLFVDDDTRFLADLALVLELPYATARSCAEALRVTEPPSVAFVDLGLPDGDGVDLIRDLGARWPDVPLVALTVARADARVLEAVRAGARGYLLKEDVGTRLEQAIREALDGGAPMSHPIARRVLDLLGAAPSTPTSSSEREALTARELATLRELANGSTYLQAAATLDVSINTLRAHVRNIYRKLAVGSKTEAVMAGLRLGIVQGAAEQRRR